MKTNTTCAAIIAAVATLSAMASPASAEPDAIGAWTKAVSKQVSDKLRTSSGTGYGMAFATIRRLPDGRAELVKMDCKKQDVARTARIAIARLRKLPPMPRGFEQMPIRVQVLLGNMADSHSYYTQLEKMEKLGDTQNRLVAARVAGQQVAARQLASSGAR